MLISKVSLATTSISPLEKPNSESQMGQLTSILFAEMPAEDRKNFKAEFGIQDNESNPGRNSNMADALQAGVEGKQLRTPSDKDRESYIVHIVQSYNKYGKPIKTFKTAPMTSSQV